jgi:hypothetical protein
MSNIDYTAYKRAYTTGDQFTLTGSDFIGYAELVDGVVTEVGTGKVLTPKGSYATDLFYTTYFTDRVVGDFNITLPATIDECLFGINDNFNYDLIKFKLDSLRTNNTYVYSRLSIASNKLPYTDSITYATVNSPTQSAFSINVSDAESPRFIANTKFRDNHYLSAFGYVVDATSQINFDNPEEFSLFAITDTNLITLTGSNTSLTVIEDSTGYETEENNLEFKKLSGIASTKTNLYISDTDNNVVLKYDIAGYNNNDSSLKNRRNYIELVGGYGGTSRQTKFKKPTIVACSDTQVAVYDKGNKAVKVFDNDFNHQARITSINVNKETIGAIGFDPDFGSLYIVTYRDVEVDNSIKRIPYLYRFSGNKYTLRDKLILDDRLALDEVVNSITFSSADSNYWYFGTNKTVYKKFKTRPTKVIGKYRSERIYLLNVGGYEVQPDSPEPVTINNRWNFNEVRFDSAQFLWNLNLTDDTTIPATERVSGLLDDSITNFSIFPGVSGTDRAIMLTEGRLYFFNEPSESAYQRVLKDRNYPNYGSEGFSLNSDSFIQQSVINTELFKVINDALTLKNNIVGRFTGKYRNDILELDEYNYDIDFNQFLTQDIENLYVHGNEENLTGSLNRCFKLIYDLQTKLMNIIQVKADSVVQPNYSKAGIIEI